VFGALFSLHGAQKVLGAVGGQAQPVGTMPWTAGVIELVCGILLVIGLLAGLAAFIASGEMAAAYFMAHAPQGPVPLQNGGELAVLYCFAFLFIAARGAGMMSVDGAMRGGSPRRR
jgi:putative oxidoreductase